MSWPDIALGVICNVRRGTTITQTQSRAGNIPVVAGGLNATYYHDTPNRPGNVITISASGANAGYVNFWRSPIFASDCSTVESDGNKVEIKFVYHFLRSQQEYINSKLRAGAAQPHVYAKDIAQLLLPLPPLAEQRRIAAILDQADSLRAKRREALGQLDSLTQSIFIEMFGPFNGSVARWESQKLRTLVSESDKVNYGVVQPGHDFPGGVPVVRVGDFDGMEIDTSKLKRIDPKIDSVARRSRLHGNEVLLSCVGSTIGKVALATEELYGFNTVRAVARITVGHNLNRVFLAHYLMTPFAQSFFRSETRSVGQPTLNIGDIEETPIPVPPISLQCEFVKRVKKVADTAASCKYSSSYLNELFASLQHRAFRGDL